MLSKLRFTAAGISSALLLGLSSSSVLAADNSSAINAQLLYTVDQMKSELRDLRGEVDELTYRLKQAESQQKERYIDLDSRIQKLSGGEADGGQGARRSGGRQDGGQSQSGAPQQAADGDPEGAVLSGAPIVESGTVLGSVNPGARTAAGDALAFSSQPATAEARTAYDNAYALIKQREYESAIDALHGFVNEHPDSDLTANAYYWLGEVYLVLPKLEPAKQSFLLVVGKFPEHRKAPDAMYKLAVTDHRLGDNEGARKVLNEVIARYPDSTAARLAADYRKQL